MLRKRAALIPALALAASVVSIVPSGAADHLEAPLAAQDGRTDINDLYAFQSPEDPDKTVLVMTVNPGAGALSPTTFDPDGRYEFKIDQDLADADDATADATISIDFGTPDNSGIQTVAVTGAVTGSGSTGTEFALSGGGTAVAGVYDDPFFFDFAAFQGTVKGMGSANFCEVEGDTTGVDFFAGLNVSAIVLEVDSASITDGDPSIGVWAETGNAENARVDRMGRPAIATVLVPDGAEDAYNAADPDMDDANFAAAASASLQALSAFGGDATPYSEAQADALADVFLPDILTFDTSSTAGYGTGPLNGRQLADDVIDISLPVVTGDASAVGGPNVGGLLTTDCVDANDKPFLTTFPYLADATQSTPAATTSYALILENLTDGQPFSPPVAVTHNAGLPTAVTVAEVGAAASDEINAIARGGDPAPLVASLEARRDLAPAIITDVVNLGRPVTPADTTVGGFADRAVYTIDARPGDVLSVFGMLICTNDGFIGLDRAELPATSGTFDLMGYDAGSEDNTELSEHIVDPCSALGPVTLAGDPNGNADSGAGVDTDPVGVIAAHPGVDGTVGDLLTAHDWDEPAARLTVVKIVDAFGDDNGDRFEAQINVLKAAGITTGTSPTTYDPSAPVTRGQMAAFINRSLGLPAAGTSPFADISGSTFEDDINRLFAAGITIGTSPTTFSPDDPMTRGQMAAFINRALSLPAAASGPFTDIATTSFVADINALFAAGITTGTSNTTYSPNDPVTRSQEAGFLTRALGVRPIAI